MAFASKSDDFSDGTGVLMGLGFPSMAAYNFTPVFDHIIQENLLERNMFSFWLSLTPRIASKLLFGKVDASLFEGNLQYFDVVDQQYWTINLHDVLVTSLPYNLSNS